MSDSQVQLPTEGTGPKVETSAVLRPDGTTVHRQRITTGDNDDAIAELNRLLSQLIVEVQHLKFALLDALH